ncbi:MAG TPA: FAD-dependent oxidoreductase [Microlunatus sp.]
MKIESVRSDVTVIGGGLAGVCAAIGAARNGAEVTLIQNRPVLGGNSSSEVRVWVCGATAHGTQHYARETGIMGELFVENQFQNPDGNPYYWDLVILEAVRAEPKIKLFLNTDVREVSADGPDDDRTINSVTGWQMGSEKLITFSSDQYIDCSGDGLIGVLAGAQYRTGREPRSEFDEPWAPEVPDNNTLGSTILFYSKDLGRPTKFVPPPFAKDIVAADIPEHRMIRTDMNGCAFWWIEWGGELDVVDDNEKIRDELQSVVYGIWDYIKNSGKFEADNLTLEWIGSVPGKREYRRFVGDHVLTQHDVLGQVEFDDRIGFGGWSIDLHPPGGVYATEHGSRHWHPDGNYHIPLRSLYSINVGNLWMAGRNISASHVAFGTTRVMATCAVLGEAAGVAASIAALDGLSPRQLGHQEFGRVRNALVRADASVLGVPNTDPADLARTATVTASSTLRRVAVEEPADRWRLDDALGMVLPVAGRLGGLEVLLDADRPGQVAVELHDPIKPQNYLPLKLIKTVTADVEAGEKQWVRFDLDWQPDQPQNGFLVFRADPAITLHTADRATTGTIYFRHREPAPNEQFTEQFRHWKQVSQHHGLCFRLTEPTEVYAADQVIGGYGRPYGGPRMWLSESLLVDPAPALELTWAEPQAIGELSLIFDDDLDEDLINLHHHRTPYEVLPSLVRDYRVEAMINNDWQTIAEGRDNRRRRCGHRLEKPVTTDRLRLVITATNGASEAHVVAVRAYA